MGKKTQVWNSLRDREYRREFVSEHIKTGLAFQIRALRERDGWTQVELGNRTNKAQESISQLENPDYGKHTISTLRKLADAFDVAILVRFVPFSELVEWTIELTPEKLAPPSYDKERQLAFPDMVIRYEWGVGATTDTPIPVLGSYNDTAAESSVPPGSGVTHEEEVLSRLERRQRPSAAYA